MYGPVDVRSDCATAGRTRLYCNLAISRANLSSLASPALADLGPRRSPDHRRRHAGFVVSTITEDTRTRLIRGAGKNHAMKTVYRDPYERSVRTGTCASHHVGAGTAPSPCPKSGVPTPGASPGSARPCPGHRHLVDERGTTLPGHPAPG